MPRDEILPPLACNAWLRWDLIERLLPAGETVLEIGPGVGSISARLSRRYEYLGVELSPVSARLAADCVAPNGGHVINGSTGCLDARFDVIAAFEVLEHLEDDVGALRTWAAHLKQGGSVLLTVPSQPEAWGANDVLAGHYRRYTRQSLSDSLDAAGLRADRMLTIGGIGGYILKWLRDRRARHLGESETGTKSDRTLASGRLGQPGNVAGIGCWAAMVPFRWIQRPFVNSDFGTGLVVRATRV